MFKLALDAGHGRNTAGKRCDENIDPNKTREWVLNDRICDKIEAKLAGYAGIEVLRVDDPTGAKDISRKDRCKAANEWGADLYLSEHHNAGIKGGKGGGTVVYAHRGANAERKAMQKDLYDTLIAHTGLRGNRAKPLGFADFDVLVGTKMPALLIENGFMDSTTDTPIILTDEFAEQTAEATVEWLVKYAGLTKKKTEPKKLYRVQVGAYSVKSNAERMKEQLIKDGYQAIIVEVEK